MIAKIAVSAATFAIDKPYSYRSPMGLDVQPGMRVQIPFGRGNRRTEGVVLSVEPGEADDLKAIDSDEKATDKDQDLLITLEVVYEFYLRGLEFLPIDIYKSHATKFLIEDGKIRPPFVAISGLGENAAWDLMNGREGKQFLSMEEVSIACPKVSKTHMQMLKEAGAFGSMPETNQVSLF